MKKIFFFFVIGLVALGCIFFLFELFLAYGQTPQQHALSVLESTKHRLEQGEAFATQRAFPGAFPEGAFFSYVLFGSSWVNVGLSSSDDSVRSHAEQEAMWAVQQLDSEQIRQQFSQPMTLKNGVFYAGWRNRLLGGILLLQKNHKDASLEAEFHAQSSEIAKAFKKSPTLFLESYPNQIWPADNLPALASLRIHDSLYGTSYTADILQPWIEHAQQKYQLKTHLFPHQVDATTGDELKTSRGASTAYLLSLLPEVDADLATQQYSLYEKSFLQNFGFFTLSREAPKGNASHANANSGPVFGGFGAVASVMHIAAAQANSHTADAVQSYHFFSLLGLPTFTESHLQYLFGKLLLYDIFLTWSGTQIRWVE